MSAENLAKGLRQHQEAVAAHKEATDKAQAIADRLAAVNGRMGAITAARVAGRATTEETNEFAALAGDAELLGRMHAEAQAAVKQASDEVHAAFIWATDAQRAHDREQAGAEYEALRARTAEIEALFVRAIAATHAAGRKIGHRALSQSWRPCDALNRAVHYNVAPEA